MDERHRLDYGVNEENMQLYRRYLLLDDIPSPSYENSEYRRASAYEGVNLMEEADQMSGNYNHQLIIDREIKQQMEEAGICSMSLMDLKSSFYEIFKSEDDEQVEESGDEQVEESGDKQVEESGDGQVEESGDEQAEESGDKQVEESGDKQVEESGDGQVEESGDKQDHSSPQSPASEEPVEAATAMVEEKKEGSFADLIGPPRAPRQFILEDFIIKKSPKKNKK